MTLQTISSLPITLVDEQNPLRCKPEQKQLIFISSANLAVSITKAASRQTYLTIRYLVDPQLEDDAFRAYAYYRWVDDTLDDGQLSQAERFAFLARQQDIIYRCYQGDWPNGLCREEYLIVDLIKSDQNPSSGLRTYINEMMAVMAFDTQRKGQFVSQEEIDHYTHALAVAVTEALHYFIGHDDYSPCDKTRYLAVTGAHITHMLRDTIEDSAVGYYNVPESYLETHGLAPVDVDQDAYRAWVHNQVKLARQCFAIGRTYLARVENLRCRFAGYAYIARFEIVLDAIETEGFLLRSLYPERKSKEAKLKMGLAALMQTIASILPGRQQVTTNLAPSLEASK